MFNQFSVDVASQYLIGLWNNFKAAGMGTGARRGSVARFAAAG
jgi:hypothetical protein